MYQVVVDNEVTGKLLFEKGGLRRRVTIIPLNKIQGHTIPRRAQDVADKVVSMFPQFHKLLAVTVVVAVLCAGVGCRKPMP